MKLSSNFIYFHDELGLYKTIDIFSEAGFEGIDFNLDLAEYYSGAKDAEFFINTRKYAEERGIKFYQAHAPFASSYTDSEQSEKRFGEIAKSIEYASLLGVEMLVVHPCNHKNYKLCDATRKEMLEYNVNFYNRLAPYAEKFGVKIAVENIGGCITETADGLCELMNILENPIFTVCYDVGHANICGQNPVEMIHNLGSFIGCTHIHDNDGKGDIHTLPFYGSTIDFEEVMKAFAEIGYKGNLNYEAGVFVKHAPIALRTESARYMAKVGHYLIDRFEFYKNHKSY